MRFDLHVHTIYSKYSLLKHDSLIRPRDLVKVALKKNLDGVAITDHDTTRGVAACLKEVRSLGNRLKIISGCEIDSKEGHILALGIKDWREERYLPAIEVIEKIRDSGGIAVAAHPYGFEFLKKGLRDKVKCLKFDGIEVLNFNNLKGSNRKAMITASKLKLGKTAGSDAHMVFDIGKVATISDADVIDSILRKRTRVEGTEASFLRIVAGNIYRAVANIK